MESGNITYKLLAPYTIEIDVATGNNVRHVLIEYKVDDVGLDDNEDRGEGEEALKPFVRSFFTPDNDEEMTAAIEQQAIDLRQFLLGPPETDTSLPTTPTTPNGEPGAPANGEPVTGGEDLVGVEVVVTDMGQTDEQ